MSLVEQHGLEIDGLVPVQSPGKGLGLVASKRLNVRIHSVVPTCTLSLFASQLRTFREDID